VVFEECFPTPALTTTIRDRLVSVVCAERRGAAATRRGAADRSPFGKYAVHFLGGCQHARTERFKISVTPIPNPTRATTKVVVSSDRKIPGDVVQSERFRVFEKIGSLFVFTKHRAK
jgi:hypothetical protein